MCHARVGELLPPAAQPAGGGGGDETRSLMTRGAREETLGEGGGCLNGAGDGTSEGSRGLTDTPEAPLLPYGDNHLHTASCAGHKTAGMRGP